MMFTRFMCFLVALGFAALGRAEYYIDDADTTALSYIIGSVGPPQFWAPVGPATNYLFSNGVTAVSSTPCFNNTL